MNHRSVYGHEEDRVVDPCTFQPFCRRCRAMWETITTKELEELDKRENAEESYNRAMRGVI